MRPRALQDLTRNYISGEYRISHGTSYNLGGTEADPEKNDQVGQSNIRGTYVRTWQINRINKINRINRINNRLIYLCKLGPGLIRINKD